MKIRLLTSRAYWYAHREELPDFRDVLIVTMAGVIGLAVLEQYETYELRKEALFISESSGRFKACLEGRRTLGSIEEHGVTWDVTCQEVLKRREK